MDNQSPADLATSFTASALWEQGSAALRAQLSEATWKTWFASVRPVDFDGKVLTLSVPNALARKRILSSYEGLLRDLLQESSGISIELDIMVETEARDQAPIAVGAENEPDDAPLTSTVGAPPSAGRGLRSRPRVPTRRRRLKRWENCSRGSSTKTDDRH